jgi:hypothetical protein
MQAHSVKALSEQQLADLRAGRGMGMALAAELNGYPASLESATDAIGRTQSTLRAAHLRYHLTTAEVLMPEQARRYGELRGYGGG